MDSLSGGSRERREVVGEVNRTQIVARSDENSLWVEVRRLPSGKPWQFAPERARRIAQFLNRAASLVESWAASNEVAKPEQAVPDNPTAAQCIQAILWNYQPNALAAVMAAHPKALGGKTPDELMDTAKGRRKVYGWALALAEGVMD